MSNAKIHLALFVEGDFIPSFSGAANRYHYLSRALQMSGEVNVVVFLCDRGWSDNTSIMLEPFTTYLINPDDFYNNPELIVSILLKEKIQFLQFGSFESAVFLGLRLASLANVHLLLEAHYEDGDFARRMGSSAEFITSIKAQQIQFSEYLDAVIYLSSDDFEHLSRNINQPKEKLFYSPSGVNIEDTHLNFSSFSSRKIIFLGNLYFHPNEVAVKVIYENVYLKLKQLGFECIIGGDAPLSLCEEYGDRGFQFLGPIKNLEELFVNTFLALAPIHVGSGMRIKILNYMAAGIPVLTSTEGACGFPKKNLLIIEDDFSKYDQVILRATHKKDEYRTRSFEGQEYIKQTLNWPAIAQSLVPFYKKILITKPTNKSSAMEAVAIRKYDNPLWLEELLTKKRFKDRAGIVKKGEYLKL